MIKIIVVFLMAIFLTFSFSKPVLAGDQNSQNIIPPELKHLVEWPETDRIVSFPYEGKNLTIRFISGKNDGELGIVVSQGTKNHGNLLQYLEWNTKKEKFQNIFPRRSISQLKLLQEMKKDLASKHKVIINTGFWTAGGIYYNFDFIKDLRNKGHLNIVIYRVVSNNGLLFFQPLQLLRWDSLGKYSFIEIDLKKNEPKKKSPKKEKCYKCLVV